MNKWSFDEKHLRNAIKKGQLLLTKKNISDSDKDKIRDEISVFERWLNGNFDYPYSGSVRRVNNSDEKYSFDELKKLIMHEVKICGSCFGNGYINLISRIVENDLFNINRCDNQNISIDEQANVTLKTYETYSPHFYEPAREIILADNSHIQEIDDTNFLSYSYGSKKILKEPFIVLNPQEGNGILNYYVQEGIEDLIPLGYSLDYYDLGPILFELLFHDKLYEEKGIKYSTDYYELISKFRNQLIDVLPILKLYQATRSSNDDEINDELFEELCYKYFGSGNLEVVCNEIYNVIKKSDIMFILSVLHAIDLREKVVSKNIDCMHALTGLNDDFLYTSVAIDNKYNTCSRYMEEINNRCK